MTLARRDLAGHPVALVSKRRVDGERYIGALVSRPVGFADIEVTCFATVASSDDGRDLLPGGCAAAPPAI